MLGRYTTGPVAARAEHSRGALGCRRPVVAPTDPARKERAWNGHVPSGGGTAVVASIGLVPEPGDARTRSLVALAGRMDHGRPNPRPGRNPRDRGERLTRPWSTQPRHRGETTR